MKKLIKRVIKDGELTTIGLTTKETKAQLNKIKKSIEKKKKARELSKKAEEYARSNN